MSADALNKPLHRAAKWTAREVMVAHLGDEHSDHTPIKVTDSKSGALLLYCSCGGMISLKPTDDIRTSLRNVCAEPRFGMKR